MTPYQPGFTGYALDRADHLRADAEALATMRGDWRARLLRLTGFDPVLTEAGDLEWGSLAEAPDDAELILLGLRHDKPHFVALDTSATGASLFRSPRIMDVLARLSAEDLATYGAARSLIDWHSRHGFCGRCGGTTHICRAGWGRRCGGCAAETLPAC